MILSIHAITGAVLGSYGTSPVQASVQGLISHYLIDFLPHFDYKINDIAKGDWESAYLEFLKILADLMIAGAVIAFIIYKNPENILSILLGSFFALFPDGLLFIHFILSKKSPELLIRRFLAGHYEFHYKIHSNVRSVTATSIIVQLLLIALLAMMIFKSYLFLS